MHRQGNKDFMQLYHKILIFLALVPYYRSTQELPQYNNQKNRYFMTIL